jgi:FixJ family two-component response regulator
MSLPAPLVCVVDDDASVRKSLLRMLDFAGFTVEAFASARAYLQREVHPGPSCLVLDIRMPELTGLDLQQALADNGRAEQIVFITGVGDIPTSVQAMKAGAVDFLPKPFDDDALIAAVEHALARSRKQRRYQVDRDDVLARLASLTPRERQVFDGVVAGKMNKEICSDLGTSIRTVKFQRAKMIEKMGVETVADLVRLARKAAI